MLTKEQKLAVAMAKLKARTNKPPNTRTNIRTMPHFIAKDDLVIPKDAIRSCIIKSDDIDDIPINGLKDKEYKWTQYGMGFRIKKEIS